MANQILCSVIVDREMWERKRKMGVSWRFVVGKGMAHLTECVPREAEIAAKYDSVLRASRQARLMHLLREKYPSIYNEILED